jgi:hypothetical protein
MTLMKLKFVMGMGIMVLVTVSPSPASLPTTTAGSTASANSPPTTAPPVDNEPTSVTAVPTNAPVALDQKVQRILSSCVTFYASLPSFEAVIASATNVKMTGMKQEMDSSYHLALSRPNEFALIKVDGMMGGTPISDGKSLIIYQPLLHKYTSTDSPAKLSDLLQPMNLAMAVGGLPLGLESFLTSDPLKTLQEHLTKSEYVGLEKIADLPAHHVRLFNAPYITDL